jgi:ribosomal protein S18 acetylase RimI-like enzyme
VPAAVTFEEVFTIEQIGRVVQIAHIVWPEHYTPIIGQAQVEYMLGNFHSPQAIESEIRNQLTHYYLIYNADALVGYTAIRLNDSHVFLSKVYILSSARGHGLGRVTLTYIEGIAKAHDLNKIRLTVNRHNINSIGAYKKMGFTITGKICTDIGEGYLMDDYQMELAL